MLSLLLTLSSLVNCLVPAGAQLHVRLKSAVGSYASKAGSPLRAVLIAPVIVNGETLLPAGATLSGKVRSVTRVGLGIRHETAGLDLDFDHLTPPDGAAIPLSARVAQVDNSRERVTPNGRIHGIRATNSLCYRVSGYLRMLFPWEVHAELTEWAIKSLIGELPEPEIYYPAGVELTLILTQPLLIGAPGASDEPARQLTGAERAELADRISDMPDRTVDPSSGRSSDLTNVLLIGSRDQIDTAFAAAGWTQANPASLRRRISWIRAAAELHGDRSGPMSSLLLDNEEPEMSWEKGLNDVAKRHHVRIWKEGEWRGQELWLAAATRDIDFAYLRPGQTLTHKIDGNIDEERDKVAYDLAFTSCVDLLDWQERPGLPRFTHNGTGDWMTTDTRAAVVGLSDCPSPHLANETVDTELLARHGRRLQRFVRREILSARNDAMRTNLYWRSFEGARIAVTYLHHRWQQNLARQAVLAQSQSPAETQHLETAALPSRRVALRTAALP